MAEDCISDCSGPSRYPAAVHSHLDEPRVFVHPLRPRSSTAPHSARRIAISDGSLALDRENPIAGG